MKFKPNVIGVLAEMICGNEPYAKFMPYRSSSYLTKFFQQVDLPFVHQGETRNRWVATVLEEINTGDPNSPYPSDELERVILNLVDPDNFVMAEYMALREDGPKYNQDMAIEKVNVALKSTGVQVIKDLKTDQPSLLIGNEVYASTASRRHEVRQVITFSPEVFKPPKRSLEMGLVGVLMPFAAEFHQVHHAIKAAIEAAGLRCERADDVWRDSVIVQDIFELIFASSAVIVDFSGRNPNVMYETGIAHTLGKIVIPISQSLDDVPFDLRHHRVLKYLPNEQGYGKLFNDLKSRLEHVCHG
jgi:hypothetical protein